MSAQPCLRHRPMPCPCRPARVPHKHAAKGWPAAVLIEVALLGFLLDDKIAVAHEPHGGDAASWGAATNSCIEIS